MTLGDACNRAVIVGNEDMSLAEAAGLLKSCHVGALVVVEDRRGLRVPVGLLTDRDVALAVANHTARLPYLRVSEVMSRDLVTAFEHESVHDGLKRMQAWGVRRLPVVNPIGGLEGIVTADDLIGIVSDELNDLVRLVVRELKNERVQRVAAQ